MIGMYFKFEISLLDSLIHGMGGEGEGKRGEVGREGVDRWGGRGEKWGEEEGQVEAS